MVAFPHLVVNLLVLGSRENRGSRSRRVNKSSRRIRVMCFSQPMSLAIGLGGILLGLYFFTINKYAAIGILYFALMEIIQFFQYSVIDKCDDPWNKFLTNLGYLHISFQPVFWNIWLFAFVEKPMWIFVYMSIAAGLLLFSRIFNVKDDELCDTRNEPLCGKQTCAFTGERHVAWNVRLRAAGANYYTPSIALHFFMLFIPTLVTFQAKPIIAMLLAGPWFGLLLTSNIHEAPAIWCYTVIAQFLISQTLLMK
jgi:hypothetical protein